MAAAISVGCGAAITRSITLSADVGPCPGAGIIVTASNITVNLNDHTITGDPLARTSSDMVGIELRRVSGVTVRNGTVQGFDAGVAVMGGGGNTITRITARNNVNYRNVTGRNSQPEDITPNVGPYCEFGDGITLFGSNNNRLEDNVAVGNGPFSGISIVFDSNDNVVTGNKLLDNDVLNVRPAGQGTTGDCVRRPSSSGGLPPARPTPIPRPWPTT